MLYSLLGLALALCSLFFLCNFQKKNKEIEEKKADLIIAKISFFLGIPLTLIFFLAVLKHAGVIDISLTF